ncbi:MAG: ABC transporter substrate-binding protein [Desulfobacterales bacterium]|nr:MAG: ABC transporter substrate-binding protein [Desulfobacterales bacterium]
MMKRLLILLTAILLFTVSSAMAETAKIGMITTLSGGGSALGIAVRDGFKLAIDQEDGKLGGYPVDLIVEDDARKPDKAKQISDRFIKKDNVDIMTGIIWSNLAITVVPKVVRTGAFYISPNAGPSLLAGKECHENYFNVAWQNDNLHEAMGQYVKDKNFKKVFILAPNYPAGKDALRGFKRFYTGKPVAEVYTKLGQKDYAAEISAIQSAKPDAVFFFLPGGMGISFIKQYNQAGLAKEIPLFGPAFSFDQTILNAVGKAALGVMNSSQWNKDIDNPANKRFVADFKKAYGRLPSLYASQGYDAARLIASALKAVGGDMSQKDAFREALRKADFESVRGPFKFGPNHHPVQDIYIRQVVEEGGVLTNRIVTKAFNNHSDAYVGQCKTQ